MGIKQLLSVFLLLSCSFFNAKFETEAGDFKLKFSGKFRPETFFGKNVALLNNNNDGDKIWYARHTLDLNLDVEYGKNTYDREVARFHFDMRNKGVWGNAASLLPTTDASPKIADAITGTHNHAIPRHLFWMRSGWLRFEINQALGLPLDYEHWFTFGLFPFSLGRGIALGDAYAVGPDLLGFYVEGNVDQYAPGALLHGEIIPKQLSYDLYTAILQNKGSNYRETTEAILSQEYGRRDRPQRGASKINFLIASRLQWRAFKDENIGSLLLEPYVLYNKDAEQKIEFLGDSSGQLGTVGLATEYAHSKFEIGFDWAINLGQQRVKGWDRNEVRIENRAGQAVIVNSHVVDQSGKKVPFVKGSQAQKIINTSAQDEAFNSQQIGILADGVGFVTGPTIMSNSANRFRNPFTNKYQGWMFVIDAAYWTLDRDLMLAIASGVASGDDNPNDETIDGVYSGFIPLQEVYSGKRVRSTFLLSGFKRPLSAPESNQSPNRFSPATNRFTNIIYAGIGGSYTPSSWAKKFNINPNLLAYWQEKPIKRFDAELNKQLDTLANPFLGVEMNLFMDYMILKDLKLYFEAALFLPGQHFRDIKGKPLNADQQEFLDRLDRTGFDSSRIPNIGDDNSYTFNLGLEFKF